MRPAAPSPPPRGRAVVLLCAGGLAIVLASLPGLQAAGAERSGELQRSDEIAIHSAIENQLSAFRRDDEATAFAFAAPSVQARFGSAEKFVRMVRETYPAVYRARDVKFQRLDVLSGEPTQRALLIGSDGVPTVAFYVMERQGDGAWRIKGCVLAPIEREPT